MQVLFKFAIAVSLFSFTLGAQQVPLSVKTVDQTGAFIPRARIEALSTPVGATLESNSDERGEAVLPLDPGSYIVSVRASGFTTWSESIEVRREAARSMTAVLVVAPLGNPIVIPDLPAIETEALPFVANISLDPLESLDSLPTRRLPRRFWTAGRKFR